MNTQQIIEQREKEKVVRIKEAATGNVGNPISTGMSLLDDLLEGGLREGDLAVVSGRPGSGKTTFGLNLMRNYLQLNPVLFSYEVIVDRLLDKLKMMGMGDDPNIFTPKRNVSGHVDWIRDRILEAILKYDSKFVVIDHLDYITADHKSDDGRRNEITSIMTRLKELSVEKKLIIVLQVHVVKGEKDKAPLGLNDLADSRSIAGQADFILFVNRKLDEENLAIGNEGMLVLAKNRYNGRQGKVPYFVTAGNIIKETL